MSRATDLQDRAVAGLLDGVAQQVARWVQLQMSAGRTQGAHDAKDAQGAQYALEALQQVACTAARLVMQAHLEGHVCVPLQALAAAVQAVQPMPHGEDLCDLLLQSGVAQRGPTPAGGATAKPLVLDANEHGCHIYLHRNFDHERRLAQHVARRLHAGLASKAEEDSEVSRVHALPSSLSDEQRGALHRCLNRQFSVISGGPGTGKTTTVVHLLLAWLRRSPQLRIALAAPTGKAAARMMDSLRQQTQGLNDPAGVRLPKEGHTLHRLLGAGPQGFAHHTKRPLALDVLVVDEASMLDLALARALFDALPPSAHLVLLGDKDQLASVEAGSVFADLCAAGPHVEQLTQNFRFGKGTGIAELAEHIRQGDEEAAASALAPFEPQGITWWLKAQQGYETYVQAVREQPQDPAGALEAFEKFRILCALREGSRGVQILNQRLTEALAPLMQPAGGRFAPVRSGSPPWSHSWSSSWYIGRPVIVGRNEPRLGLYNGDIGVTLPDAQGELRVWFAGGPEGAMRAFHPAQVPGHETAWAMTAHRAQGSEFEDLLVLLPEQESRVVTREWIYTAVTRARSHLMWVAPQAVLLAGLRASVRRHGALQDQIAREQQALSSGETNAPSSGSDPAHTAH